MWGRLATGWQPAADWQSAWLAAAQSAGWRVANPLRDAILPGKNGRRACVRHTLRVRPVSK
jgi:hypothetical protein